MTWVISKKQSFIILFFILILAIFFRFYHFPNNPPSLNWDEVSTGYNAHSILLTGKDEYGKKMPVYFRSLDDYKLPVTIYFTVVSEALFGYNDFAVRLPTAFFGVLTIAVIFFLSYELTSNRAISLLTSLSLAILPWHVEYSRGSFEATNALFFFSLATLLFIVAVKRNIHLLPFSIVLYSLSTYTYPSFRIITPIFFVGLWMLYRKKLSLKKFSVFVALLLMGICFFFIARDLTQATGLARFHGVSVFSNSDVFDQQFKEMQYEGSLGINLPRRFFHENHLLINSGLLIRGYMTHFSPDFLFFDYGKKAHYIPFVGLLYLWMIPFILVGLYFLLKKYHFKTKFILISLILIAPIPASVTYDVPNEIRSMLLVIPFQIMSAIGVYETFLWLYKKNILIYKTGILIFVLFFSLEGWYFFRQYQIHLPHELSQEWLYGRKEMTTYLEKNKTKYHIVHISQNLHEPYIFLLYYSKYDPNKYLANGGTISGGYAFEGNHVDNYRFQYFNFTRDITSDNDLFVGTPDDFPKDIKRIYTINYLDNTPAIYIVEAKSIKEKLQETL